MSLAGRTRGVTRDSVRDSIFPPGNPNWAFRPFHLETPSLVKYRYTQDYGTKESLRDLPGSWGSFAK